MTNSSHKRWLLQYCSSTTQYDVSSDLVIWRLVHNLGINWGALGLIHSWVNYSLIGRRSWHKLLHDTSQCVWSLAINLQLWLVHGLHDNRHSSKEMIFYILRFSTLPRQFRRVGYCVQKEFFVQFPIRGFRRCTLLEGLSKFAKSMKKSWNKKGWTCLRETSLGEIIRVYSF